MARNNALTNLRSDLTVAFLWRLSEDPGVDLLRRGFFMAIGAGAAALLQSWLDRSRSGCSKDKDV